jgi:hypothetical protein
MKHACSVDVPADTRAMGAARWLGVHAVAGAGLSRGSAYITVMTGGDVTTDCDPAAAFPPSPVPSDADLWPGELPFTAWGQHAHGRLDLRVFDQATWWVDIAQQPHRLEDMSDGYVANVIEFLVDDAEYFHGETLRREWLQMCGDLLLGRMSADLVARTVGAPSTCDLTPMQWLESTPLMRALRRIRARRMDVS